ncbi:MAG: ABC transporter substrate-binding protein [Bacillota bacterium]
MKAKQLGLLLFTLLFVFALIGCSADNDKSQSASSTADEKTGGTIRIAYNAQPPTLDPHVSPAASTKDVARQIFEPLVTVNSNYQVVPMLAESIDESDDGKTYTFHLREGIKFHNGKEMTSEDVVASMNNWLEKSTLAKSALNGVVFTAEDPSTVVMQVNSPNALSLSLLATTKQFPGIMPKEIIESADATGVKEFIGTGPFKFVEWKKDQYIHITKYQDYQSVDTPTDGLSGKKEVFVDDVYFDIAPDSSTRIAGIETGQYDYSILLPFDNYEQVASNEDLAVTINPVAITAATFNKKGGVFKDVKMRQAINHALDLNELALVTFSNEDFYSLNSSYFPDQMVDWTSELGKEHYNQKDPEKAKQLLSEAGYKGETVKLLTNRDYEYFYNASVVVKEQLEKIGMNVELIVTDLATSFDMRNDPGKWDLFVGGYTYVGTPIELTFLQPGTWAGSDDPKMLKLLNSINTSSSMEEAKKHWNELQGYAWESLPIIKIADYSAVSAISKKVEGNQYFDGLILWNVKKSQ